MNHPESLHNFLSELVRCGLPPKYAQRAAAELVDHHGDLVDELRSTGINEAQAVAEALRRLGDSQALVKNTVREYQRRHWCGRWRLVTFVLAPLPVLIVAWIVSLFALVFASGQYVLWTGIEMDGIKGPHHFAPLWMKYAGLISIFVLVPTFVTYTFAKLANRAALGWPWIVVVACILGLAAGTFRFERADYSARVLSYDQPGGQPLARQARFFVSNPLLETIVGQQRYHVRRWFARNPFQTCQLLLPLAVAGVVVLRRRQLVMHSQRLLGDAG
jgi:hypothetical protein